MNPIPSSTAFTETPPPAAPRTPLPERPAARKSPPLPLRALTALASLRLTVVLFVLALFLVFCGTLAQMNASNWTVINEYFRSWGVVWIPWQLFVQFAQIFFGVDSGAQVPGSFPFPAGGILGGLLLLNLLAAHATRFKLSWGRSGILILHAGLVVLMLSELVTWHFAVEGNMTIEEHGSSNYLEHREFSELAIIDSSAPKEDEVVVVPERLLRQGGRIENELLPFDVEVLQYMTNSAYVAARQLPAGQQNPATAGAGRQAVAVEKPEGSGTDPEQRVNIPSAYVTFRKKGTGESLGTYLVSLWLTAAGDEQPQHVTVDGKTYSVALRFKRTYKPYTVYLKEFRHEVFPGTDTPKDFSSFVRVVDPSRNEDRETRIWMNHPLFYAGETFYQQGFLPGDTGTILQVVRNPGKPLPYLSLPLLSCILVAVGLLIHFGLKLMQFLTALARQRGLALPAAAPRGDVDLALPRRVSLRAALQVLLGFSRTRTGAAAPAASPVEWLVPLGVVLLAVIYLAVTMIRPRDDAREFQLGEAANLPVLDRGRIKPLDTVARTSLMILSGKQEYTDKEGHRQPAVRWALDVMTSRLTKDAVTAEAAESARVFRIDNLDVLNLLELKPRSGFRYALLEFMDKIDKVQEAATRAQKRDAKERDLFDNKVMDLAQHLTTYINLAHMTTTLLVVPPPPGGGKNDWKPLLAALRQQQEGQDPNPALPSLSKVFVGYAHGEAAQFNQGLSEYRQLLQSELPASANMASLEVFFNNFAPFYRCEVLYVWVCLLACLSWLPLRGFREVLRRSAFWLMVLTLAVHTLALLTRMYLQGRPPVTNLYSSAVFIGWGCVILGVVIELIFRLGIGSAVAGALGFATLLISDHLATGGDTLEMMQAVLDTNFWLATHVVAVTTGYTAAFVAGALAMVYLTTLAIGRLTNPRQGAFEVQLEPDGMKVDLLKVLGQMVYGVVCFAVLFSFTGTVLGGIWADESWGRFWGWDPKENGALLIVIWSALILHARWAGLVKPFGMAVLAVLGNQITSFSWFGTNQLGVGLHAYGFNKTLAEGLRWFWISQVVFLVAVMGMLALARWMDKHTRPTMPAG